MTYMFGNQYSSYAHHLNINVSNRLSSIIFLYLIVIQNIDHMNMLFDIDKIEDPINDDNIYGAVILCNCANNEVSDPNLEINDNIDLENNGEIEKNINLNQDIASITVCYPFCSWVFHTISNYYDAYHDRNDICRSILLWMDLSIWNTTGFSL